MLDIANTLRSFREHCGLAPEDLAKFLPIEANEILALENGERAAGPDILAEYALIAGAELEEFMLGQVTESPPSLLYRALPHRQESVEEMANTGVPQVLGAFLRSVKRVHCLRQKLDCSTDLSWLQSWREHRDQQPRWASLADEDIHAVAEEAAAVFRQTMGLGDAPISSMTGLLQDRLGITLFFITPEELNPVLDGVSTCTPTPGILVNLIQGAETWWRTRMTLAHELGHILLDLPLQESRVPLMLSPASTQLKKTPERWTLTSDHENIEKRANSFAAHLLAPPEAVEQLIGTNNPTSEESVVAVAQHFGLGRVSSINVLKNVFDLNYSTRQRMVGRTHAHWDAATNFEESVDVGLQRGELLQLTLRALGEASLGKIEARRLLNLEFTDPLPPFIGLSEEDRRPIFTEESIIMRVTHQHLQGERGSQYTAGDVQPGPRGWIVEILRSVSRTEYEHAGVAHVSFDREVKKVEMRESV